MNKIKTLKTVVGCVAAIGIGVIVDNAIKVNTPSNIGRITRICTVVGSIILSGMLSAMASKYVENTVDEVVKAVKDGTEGQTTEQEAAE